MFNIQAEPSGLVKIVGRLDTTQASRAGEVLGNLKGTITLDLKELEYISSAGLGVLILTHNRLKSTGGMLIILNPSDHVRHILHLARLDQVLQIQ